MEETPIKDGMIFKSNQNQFKCHIIKHKKNNYENGEKNEDKNKNENKEEDDEN